MFGVHYSRFPCTPYPRFDEHTRAAIDGRDIETSRARKPTFGLLRPGPVCGAIRQNLWSSTPSKQLIWWNPEHALQKDMRQHLPQNRAGDERPPDIAFAREELPLTFAIKATDQFAHHPQQLQEAGLQLLDALDRLESADRHFQIHFRKASAVERRGPLAPNGQVGNGSDGVGS